MPVTVNITDPPEFIFTPYEDGTTYGGYETDADKALTYDLNTNAKIISITYKHYWNTYLNYLAGYNLTINLLDRDNNVIKSQQGTVSTANGYPETTIILDTPQMVNSIKIYGRNKADDGTDNIYTGKAGRHVAITYNYDEVLVIPSGPVPTINDNSDETHNGRHHVTFTNFILSLRHYADCITALNLINIKITEYEKQP